MTLLMACASSGTDTAAVASPEAAPPAQTASGDARFDPPFAPVRDDMREPPRFKPSSSSAEALPITTDAYGAFSGAPDAPKLGDKADDFSVALASGGTFDLDQARAAGPVLLMFYRGFW